MPLLLMALIGLAFVQAAAFNFAHANRTIGYAESQQVAKREADLYRSFALAASYVMAKEPFAGSAVQTRTWTQLRASPHVPPHLKNLEMPAGWRVRGTASAWVICAPMSEPAVLLLKAGLPAQDPATAQAWLQRVWQGGQDYWVLG
ncbi:MAG: hypothetical protein N2690_05805, partial [Rhodocyclaceae bacterium]|nr:hypothetical protein [Rhodocyclaceae bacterium]